MNEQAIREFLDGKHVGVLGVNRRQGGPQLSPVWYSYEDGFIWIPTELKVAKVSNIARDPEVSFCVDDKQPPHKGLVMYCTAEIITEDIYDRRQGIMSRYLGDEDGAKIAAEPRPSASPSSASGPTAPTPTTTPPPIRAIRTWRTTASRLPYSPIRSFTSNPSCPSPGTTKPSAILCCPGSSLAPLTFIVIVLFSAIVNRFSSDTSEKAVSFPSRLKNVSSIGYSTPSSVTGIIPFAYPDPKLFFN